MFRNETKRPCPQPAYVVLPTFMLRIYSVISSDVNKDLTFKAKDKDQTPKNKDKDQTFKAKDQDKD